ncbi:YwmB family TATA-box binding protein (plasmid) [Metabacillus halosaccharovorans]|uniref:YwmB family TATA-box binding protein n=1 Tax=Metabacillus halosaccharovorans TaxID=930124 RepID=UPI0015E126DD|nr:YwmB family TATA-box binding protein [Metabacillus halosaccharovorans]MCM3441491.1 YwmB family TATA-box binding protein [Metabacillus halosaccharovorans]
MKILSTIIIFSIILFFGFIQLTNVLGLPTFQELDEMKRAAEKNDIDIQKWNVYIKAEQSNISLNKIRQKLHKIFAEKSGYEWKKEADQHHYQAIGVLKQENLLEKIIISVLPKNGEYTITYTFQLMVEGDLESKVMTEPIIPFDYKNKNTFITVEGIAINHSPNRLSEKILSSMNAEKVEELHEQEFVSVSGYKENWNNNNLKLKNEKLMNIQVGVRELDDSRSKVTIATPIIISEY